LKRALVGSRNKKIFSAVVLAIIGYLLYAKNKKSATDSLRLPERREKKVGLV
jgi:hypothetical protein